MNTNIAQNYLLTCMVMKYAVRKYLVHVHVSNGFYNAVSGKIRSKIMSCLRACENLTIYMQESYMYWQELFQFLSLQDYA